MGAKETAPGRSPRWKKQRKKRRCSTLFEEKSVTVYFTILLFFFFEGPILSLSIIFKSFADDVVDGAVC